MKVRKILAALAATLVLTGAVVSGVAAASSGRSGSAADPGSATSTEAATEATQSVQSSAADPDNVQEGDQNAPDAVEANEEPGSGSEGVESDGPGGHEDPPGDVNHEFEGDE